MVEPIVDFLQERAGGGRALEPAIGMGPSLEQALARGIMGDADR